MKKEIEIFIKHALILTLTLVASFIYDGEVDITLWLIFSVGYVLGVFESYKR